MRPRILHIVESFDKGAVENWLLDLMQSEQWLSNDIEFFCLLPGDLVKEEYVARRAKLHHAYFPIGTLSFLRQLRELIQSRGITHIHSHHDVMTGWYALAAPKKKWIWHFHNCDFEVPSENVLKKRLLFLIARTMIRRAICVVGISRQVADAVKEVFVSNGVRVINYGFSWVANASTPTPDNPKNGPLRCGFVGRMNRFKNPLFLCDVFSDDTIRKSCTLDFYGEGDLAQEVAKVTNQYDELTFWGWSEDIRQTLSKYDVFLFPRLEAQPEGLGIVLLEAQIAGLAVISSPYISEEVCCVDDFHRLPLNTASWRTYLQRLSKRKPSKSAVFDSGWRDLHQRFGLDHCVSNLTELYEDL